jgi:succinate dehydrogenase / fumarate reductase membrane anchor subunit
MGLSTTSGLAPAQRVRTVYANPSRAARARPEGPGRERFWWWFMRISGLLLVLLALGHMLIMHVLVEVTGQEVNFAFVSSRWGNLFWRVYDGLLLVLAFVHGANGARIVISDYVRDRTARRALIGLVALASAAWILMGLLVVIFFDPASAPDVAGPFS